MRGRKPKPTALAALHGKPGKRAAPKNEPKPPKVDGDLPAPKFLSKDAAEEWRRKVASLRAMRMLTEIDTGMLTAWCSAWGDFVRADRELRRKGQVITDEKGVLRRNPWTMVKSKAIEQLTRISSEFGFTPASRPRIGGRAVPLGSGDGHSTTETAAPDSFQAFLNSDPDGAKRH